MLTMDIEKELSSNNAMLLVLGSLNYSESVMGVINKLSGKNVCFVTLNKTYPAVDEWMIKNRINTKNFAFIDAISKAIQNLKVQAPKCRYVTSPSALTEMSIAISEMVGKGVDYLMFDSISTLLVYNNEKQVEKFISGIVNKARSSETKSMFFILENDKLIQPCSMFMDKVLEFNKN
jgi:hypothetical protein